MTPSTTASPPLRNKARLPILPAPCLLLASPARQQRKQAEAMDTRIRL